GDGALPERERARGRAAVAGVGEGEAGLARAVAVVGDVGRDGEAVAGGEGEGADVRCVERERAALEGAEVQPVALHAPGLVEVPGERLAGGEAVAVEVERVVEQG